MLQSRGDHPLGAVVGDDMTITCQAENHVPSLVQFRRVAHRRATQGAFMTNGLRGRCFATSEHLGAGAASAVAMWFNIASVPVIDSTQVTIQPVSSL